MEPLIQSSNQANLLCWHFVEALSLTIVLTAYIMISLCTISDLFASGWRFIQRCRNAAKARRARSVSLPAAGTKPAASESRRVVLLGTSIASISHHSPRGRL